MGVVAVVHRRLPGLRTALRGVRESIPPTAQLAAVAVDMGDQDAPYLLRQYLRGRLRALGFAHSGVLESHCGLDFACGLMRADYLARVDDTFALRPGWLEQAIAALQEDPTIGCLSLTPPADYHRGRGRPRTVHVEPVPVDRLDMHCFVVPHDVIAEHGSGLFSTMVVASVGDCALQKHLHHTGRKLAFLPGFIGPFEEDAEPLEFLSSVYEEERPVHESASAALECLQQVYLLGEDALLTCLSCGETELEVLAARIRFCERHQVPIGYWYEMRCPACGEIHYKDDYQLRCPD